MPDKTEIKATVLQIAQEQLDSAPGQDIELEDLVRGDIREYLDSIKLFSLVVAVEDHFKICLEPEDDAAITTLEDVVETIDRLLQEQEGTPGKGNT